MAKAELGSQKLFGFILPVGADGELIKQSLFAGLTAVFLLTVFIFFVFPRFSDLVVAGKGVKEMEEAVNKLSKSLDALDNYKMEVSPSARDNVYLAIPTKFDPGYILLSLRQLASKSNVSLVSYVLGGGSTDETATAKSSLVSHQVKLEISGLPVDLIDFVENLDSYLPIASVLDLSISEVSKIFVSGTVGSRLKLSLNYYHKPLSSIASGAILKNYLTLDELSTISSLASYTRLGTTTFSEGQTTTTGNQNLFGM